jgi:cyclopropane-fatty-acyl-phospholipid synthase
VLYAAGHHGVNALGITLSKPQADFANERISQAKMSHRCLVEVRDYREMTRPDSFDKIASIGMFEHVGEKLLPEYFDRARLILRCTGAKRSCRLICACCYLTLL